LCWTEKADDYSAPRRASASVCIKTNNPARRPAESSIIADFCLKRHLDIAATRLECGRKPRKIVLERSFWTILGLSFPQ
jgi:hypothetical protein